MSKNKTREELVAHKEEAIQCLSQYMNTLINSGDPKLLGKSDKLSYWLKDWTSFLNFETEFSPSSLRRYKRGEIIKVHLGFNVGSEEGGLHYAVVMDKNNSRNSPIVTIVPLTSVKSNTDIEHLHNGNIFLGNELFTNLQSKLSITKRSVIREINSFKTRLEDCMPSEIPMLESRMTELEEKVILLEKMKAEINKIKRGSIALTCQITTISKIRIYDPKTNYDVLSNIKLSNEKLDLLDKSIKELYTK